MVPCKLAIIKVRLLERMSCNLCFLIEDGCPNYYRNTFHGPDVTNREKHIEHATFESGLAARHEAGDDDNFSQPRIFYRVNSKISLIINNN
jgi:catalase